jgi:hypothetical protein
MINAKLQSIIDTKSAIGNAIVNKGGTITGETPFFNYAAQIDNISTGTPQTIFAASDGSKWARTNAVNLTNVSNNVTSDFNYWQPANNSTSDPILNIGTVGANISGNIRLVPVNQVNIAQYVNLVATDNNGAKYVGYNGIDANTNPTPTGNTTFNRWLLNNSATGTVIFANATFVNGGIYNGPNASLNIAEMSFVGNTASYGGQIRSIATNNGFIYVGGDTQTGVNRGVRQYHESNLVVSGNTVNFGGDIFSVTTNNGFVYAGGASDVTYANGTVRKYHESNLVVLGNTVNYVGYVTTITINNGFIYAGGTSNRTVQKYGESNLTRVGNTIGYGGEIFSIATNNGFVYAVGELGSYTNGVIRKFHESNLVISANSSNLGGFSRSITINNGFVYVSAGNFSSTLVSKYHESNLVFVGNTALYGGGIQTITTNNGFIYVGGSTNQRVQKFYESNLAFVGVSNNYNSFIAYLTTNNGFIYAGGDGERNVKKYNEQTLSLDNQTFYNITTIKE